VNIADNSQWGGVILDDLAADPAGRLLAVGACSGYPTRVGVARFSVDGRPDYHFGDARGVGFSCVDTAITAASVTPQAVAVSPDGWLAIAGNSSRNGTTDFVTGRLNPTPPRSGYWMLGSGGQVHAFGDARGWPVNGTIRAPNEAVDLEPTPTGDGYWIIDDSGFVTCGGNAVGCWGVLPGRLLAGEKVSSLSSTPSGRGYWVFTTKGRVFPFGDARSFGDMAGTVLNGPVLDSIATPTGRGYYMVASDGGIFAFGDAEFAGSMGDKKLNATVRSLVPDPDGDGYWLVAGDGGTFAFHADFHGSMGNTPLSKPIVGMVPFGNGYLMVGADGGIFNFSNHPFYGSLGANPPPYRIVSVAALNDEG
jgi:hypothetical protein